MTSAEVIAKVRPGAVSQNAPASEATGLIVNLTLKGTVPEVGMVASIHLGNISIGDVSCEHLEPPPAPTAEELLPADGVSTGGDTVTLRGSGFTADTTVAVGDNEARDVVVLSGSELTFMTPVRRWRRRQHLQEQPAGPSSGGGTRHTAMPRHGRH